MVNPKVSILTATYNRAKLVSRAIESVLSQSFSNWELIAVNDTESDGTSEVMAKWQKKDRRIKYLVIPRCGRIAIVSNFGLQQARGEYIAILDDDDWWINKDKLKRQVDFLDKNSEYVGCGGGAIAIDEKERELFKFLKFEQDKEIKKRALYANPMINSTTLFRRSAAQRVGLYDKSLLQFADWDFWLKMGLVGKLYNFQEYFAYYLMWGKGTSFLKQKENAKSGIRIVRRYKNKYPGFNKAIFIYYFYYFYAYIPDFIKKFLNPFLSRLKKVIFSKESLRI